MKKNLTHKTLILSAALLLMGGGIAFAQGWGGGYGYGGGPMMGYGGYGYGGHMMGYGPGGGGYGMGPGMMGYGGGYGQGPGAQGYYGCPGYGYGQGNGYGYGNLTQEQRQQLQASQQKFFNDTRDLREQIQNKRQALGEAMAQPNPDESKVTQLQKDLSKLESDFDQKAVRHQVEIRKILPDQQQ